MRQKEMKNYATTKSASNMFRRKYESRTNFYSRYNASRTFCTPQQLPVAEDRTLRPSAPVRSRPEHDTITMILFVFQLFKSFETIITNL